MKRFIVIAAAVTSVFVLSLTATAVHAQSYPNRSIQMIIPIPAAAGEMSTAGFWPMSWGSSSGSRSS